MAPAARWANVATAPFTGDVAGHRRERRRRRHDRQSHLLRRHVAVVERRRAGDRLPEFQQLERRGDPGIQHRGDKRIYDCAVRRIPPQRDEPLRARAQFREGRRRARRALRDVGTRRLHHLPLGSEPELALQSPTSSRAASTRTDAVNRQPRLTRRGAGKAAVGAEGAARTSRGTGAGAAGAEEPNPTGHGGGDDGGAGRHPASLRISARRRWCRTARSPRRGR